MDYYVGFRGQTYVPEIGRRVVLEGIVHLTRPDGWKVNDLVIVSRDGTRLDRPVSFTELVPGRPKRPDGSLLSQAVLDTARSWIDKPGSKGMLAVMLGAFLAKGGFKGVIVVVAGVLATLAAFTKRWRPRATG